ncbi:MAG: hypothetical protein WCG31_05125 [Deltaproteobacteria bacterium]
MFRDQRFRFTLRRLLHHLPLIKLAVIVTLRVVQTVQTIGNVCVVRVVRQLLTSNYLRTGGDTAKKLPQAGRSAEPDRRRQRIQLNSSHPSLLQKSQ